MSYGSQFSHGLQYSIKLVHFIYFQTAAPDSPGMLDRLFGTNKKPKGSLFHDYVPLNQTGENYAFTFFIRFNETQNGLYFLYFHSCLDYREHGFSNKVAVDFTVKKHLVEKLCLILCLGGYC